MVLYAPLALDEETRDTHWEAPIHQKVLSRQTLKTEGHSEPAGWAKTVQPSAKPEQYK